MVNIILTAVVLEGGGHTLPRVSGQTGQRYLEHIVPVLQPDSHEKVASGLRCRYILSLHHSPHSSRNFVREKSSTISTQERYIDPMRGLPGHSIVIAHIYLLKVVAATENVEQYSLEMMMLVVADG